MSIVPVLLDTRPSYAIDAPSTNSMLLLPAASEPLLREVMRSVLRVTAHRPVVLSSFEPDAEYVARIRAGYSDVDTVLGVRNLHALVERFAPSDSFLFIAPACYPSEGVNLRPLCTTAVNDARMVRHLVAFEAPTLHTKELVQADGDGHVRRIQRYFEPVTWPFPSGVLASLVPVACAQIVSPLTVSSLEDLRMQLSANGIPNVDVPFHGDCFDLTDEAGVLAFSERRVNALSTMQELRPGRGQTNAMVSATATIHDSARLVGPVVVRDKAEIGAGALIVGPATIGDGAVVSANAVVAQCLVMPGAVVAPSSTVRHRIVSGDSTHAFALAGQRRHAAPSPAATPEPVRRLAIPPYVAVKAIFEPVLALLALIVLSPLLFVIAVLVKSTSSGPIFYGDSREGKDAKPFKCWKFRSMLTNADEMQRALAAQQQMDGPQFKMNHDPRVTKVGAKLRQWNVDELPQLWNIVRGEMSFVGPRPSPFRENQICVPWRNGRLSVRPGVTGLWQVCRKDRENGDFHQWIHYDLLYVRNISFRLDLMILAATILTLGGRRPVPLRVMISPKKRSRSTRRTAAAFSPRGRSRAEAGPRVASP
ncbi:MAG: sugar transferase [Gemmatimonadaceae bacterium]|nr:sugar transferase [Gemmatimonadaceae bacterium]